MSIEEIQAGLKKLERLADLAFGVASASDVNLVRQSIMMSAQSDITELEKAIACIALYWYNQNVKFFTTSHSSYGYILYTTFGNFLKQFFRHCAKE